jgi:dienelactone hydrolase
MTFAQTGAKQKLGENAILSWPTISGASISKNGRYILYEVSNEPRDSQTIYLCERSGQLIRSFPYAHNAHLSDNSRQVYFLSSDRVLTAYDIAQKKERTIGKILKYALLRTSLILTDDKGTKIVAAGGSVLFSRSGSYDFFVTGDKRDIILKKSVNNSTELWNLDPVTLKCTFIRGCDRILGDVKFDATGKQCSYLVHDTISDRQTIYLYNIKDEQERPLVTNQDLGLDSAYRLNPGSLSFNKWGDLVYFAFRKSQPDTTAVKGAPLIWKYFDPFVPIEPIPESKGQSAAINTITGKLVVCKNGTDVNFGDMTLGYYALVTKTQDKPWFEEYNESKEVSLFSFKDGTSRSLFRSTRHASDFAFRIIADRFIFWFDNAERSWMSFDIHKNRLHKLADDIPFALYDERAAAIRRIGAWGHAGDIPSENAVLLYDQFDIWKFYLDNRKPPENITAGLGRKKQLTFTVVSESVSLPSDAQLILSAYDRQTKMGGYTNLTLGKRFSFDIQQLESMSVRSRKPVGIYASADGKVMSADDGSAFIVLKESAEHSSNVYFTQDFKSYRKISAIEPERSYHWLKDSLIHCGSFSGEERQAIIYRPDTLEPGKRYPVILNYYEKRSDQLHAFLKPQYSYANLNIPMFVSEGYIVVVPDIYSWPGHNGDGTLSSARAAIEAISKLPYADTARMGIQGHSYGGWQTNYLLTHTHEFKAACEAAGVADQVSSYGQYTYGIRQYFYEIQSQGSAFGFGVTPWTSPEVYIRNSPIFNLGNVTTPLLMMHNRPDSQVPFAQAVELYLGLRRAGKRVWFLEYSSDNNHWLYKRDDQKDYHNRMLQFFDHYLKGKPAPSWMTESVDRSNHLIN